MVINISKEEIMDILNRAWIVMQIKASIAKEKVTDFLKAQKGVSNVVAAILILLIVVILVGVFWDKLSKYVSDLFGKIFGSKVPDSNDLK